MKLTHLHRNVWKQGKNTSLPVTDNRLDFNASATDFGYPMPVQKQRFMLDEIQVQHRAAKTVLECHHTEVPTKVGCVHDYVGTGRKGTVARNLHAVYLALNRLWRTTKLLCQLSISLLTGTV